MSAANFVIGDQVKNKRQMRYIPTAAKAGLRIRIADMNDQLAVFFERAPYILDCAKATKIREKFNINNRKNTVFYFSSLQISGSVLHIFLDHTILYFC